MLTSRVFTGHCGASFWEPIESSYMAVQLRSGAALVHPEAGKILPGEEVGGDTYRNLELVAHYASLDYLTPCERLVFDSYLKPGMTILDVGVGGGRTTPHLSGKASRYVGVDSSEEMIRACRSKFPALRFLTADASDLAVFADESFDAIVIAFNGLDCLFPKDKRWQGLREFGRVLRPGGVLLFSSHNPRSILVRPAWSQERLRAFTMRVVSEKSFMFGPTLFALKVAKAGHSWLRAMAGSAWRIPRRVTSAAFWRGEGYLFDAADGGRMTHHWTPQRVTEELTRFDFRFETALGDDYPRRSGKFVTDWYYYVFSKARIPTGKPCA